MTQSVTKKVMLMKGLGVSSGIAIGKAYLIDRGEIEPAQYCHLDTSAVEAEIERFKNALDQSRKQTRQILERLDTAGKGKEHGRIIEAHLLILKDEMLINDTVKEIREQKINAEWALKNTLDGFIEFFEGMEDEYLKERAADIEHTVNRILINLMGSKHDNISEISTPSIVVAHDLSPSDTAEMVKGRILGFLTNIGGRTSHTAITARSLEIPAIVGLEAITHQVQTGDTLILDGSTGTVIINPSDTVLELYKKRRTRFEEYERELMTYRDLPCETTDGHRVELLGNIEIIDEVESLNDHGAEGIGLYRSEFLYLGREDLPTEQEHLRAYKNVVKKMRGAPVIIRTLDVGADKIATTMEVTGETNPALGLRAVRYCFKRVDVFKTQLRAILRASAFGNLKILFPMISGIEEVRRAKAILEDVKRDLEEEGLAFNAEIEVGIMIEIPSAALIADHLAKEVDFFSIGTNDLIQYSLAIDRINEHVAYLYEPGHPAVLRVIKQVSDAARKAGIEVGVCGEMAGEPVYALFFLGLGIEHLSMSAYSILRVKKLIRAVSYSKAKRMCNAILKMATAKEIENYLTDQLSKLYTEEF